MNVVPEEFRGESRAVGRVIHPRDEWRERAERAEARVAELQARCSHLVTRWKATAIESEAAEADRDAALDLLRQVEEWRATGRVGPGPFGAVSAFLARVDSGTEPK